jgi:methyl coenzyme M reductase subunit D
MKNKQKVRSKPPFSKSELAVYYDAAADYSMESFEKITKRVLPHGWKLTSAAFKKEARTMYGLVR